MSKIKQILIISFYIFFFIISEKIWANPLADSPNFLSGAVLEKNSLQALPGVRVTAYINEADFIPILGPEGMTRPVDEYAVVVETNNDGIFVLNLLQEKIDLKKRYPNKKFLLKFIFFHKDGYNYVAESCKTETNCSELKKTFFMAKNK